MCHSDNILISDNGIGAKVFSEMTEEEVNDPSLGFNFGAKKILKRILAGIKVTNR